MIMAFVSGGYAIIPRILPLSLKINKITIVRIQIRSIKVVKLWRNQKSNNDYNYRFKY
jgi:hypothetical protein